MGQRGGIGIGHNYMCRRASRAITARLPDDVGHRRRVDAVGGPFAKNSRRLCGKSIAVARMNPFGSPVVTECQEAATWRAHPSRRSACARMRGPIPIPPDGHTRPFERDAVGVRPLPSKGEVNSPSCDAVGPISRSPWPRAGLQHDTSLELARAKRIAPRATLFCSQSSRDRRD